ncbi:MAG: hypothetical protein IJU71_05995, partial [Selenomonadaceae bacterium]|nr:hypothetical protein [Selenomonadaceae bacterium]
MATDEATVLRGIQLDQENIIDDQNLILETLTFVLNLLAENREAAANLNRRLDEVFLMVENVGELEERSELLEQELRAL